MLNTLTIAHNLSESGLKREQAEAIAHVVADATQSQLGDLASKDFVHNQINKVRGEMNYFPSESQIKDDVRRERARDIADLRREFDSEIATVYRRMMPEIFGMKTEIAGVKTEIAGAKTEIDDLRSEMKLEIADLHGKMETEIAAVRTEIADLRGEMKTEIAALRSETRGLETRLLRLIVAFTRRRGRFLIRPWTRNSAPTLDR